MRILVSVIFFYSYFTLADTEISFLGKICLQGFEKTSMPQEGAERFCKCIEEDIRPKLNARQRAIIRDARSRLEHSQQITEDYFVSSGVRDLVIAGQANCKAEFYPPSHPITVTSGQLELTMRCNSDSYDPELFIYIRGGELFTMKEQDRMADRMMNDDFDPDFAKVIIKVDTHPAKSESWEIDVTGQIVSSPQPYALMAELRRTSSVEVTISRGRFRYQGKFVLANIIPPRWSPCGGKARQ